MRKIDHASVEMERGINERWSAASMSAALMLVMVVVVTVTVWSLW